MFSFGERGVAVLPCHRVKTFNPNLLCEGADEGFWTRVQDFGVLRPVKNSISLKVLQPCLRQGMSWKPLAIFAVEGGGGVGG